MTNRWIHIRNYKQIAKEEKDKIKELIDFGFNKTKIAEEIGCTRKTLLKVLDYLNMEHYYFEVNSPFDDDGLKMCTECREHKDINEYYLINNRRHISVCKECRKKAERLKYKKRTLTLNEYKENIGCAKCKDKRAYVLDFHHKDKNEKGYSISKNPNISLESPKFLEEIEKCIILCSNCHREYHYLERELGIDLEEYISSVDKTQ